ncbi:hypothetical protein CCY99_06685 [Helicobacter sp. 16-1353]|uniref:hypothetical protein n=1 Tax=Helicobacter sp. 16-1353 TaxID=2004996 RepID=UPI000DCF398F|nr:hypothetical protein [Helicobacter sp. 16-1353]RAX53048.1 hypothetical protein CCY99_06685 [Helicobacter sp. 16-1353]
MDKIEQNELLDEIIMMLMAALSLAGVKDESMDKALEEYQNIVEEMDDDAIYDYKAVRDIILKLKNTKRELFK